MLSWRKTQPTNQPTNHLAYEDTLFSTWSWSNMILLHILCSFLCPYVWVPSADVFCCFACSSYSVSSFMRIVLSLRVEQWKQCISNPLTKFHNFKKSWCLWTLWETLSSLSWRHLSVWSVIRIRSVYYTPSIENTRHSLLRPTRTSGTFYTMPGFRHIRRLPIIYGFHFHVEHSRFPHYFKSVKRCSNQLTVDIHGDSRGPTFYCLVTQSPHQHNVSLFLHTEPDHPFTILVMSSMHHTIRHKYLPCKSVVRLMPGLFLRPIAWEAPPIQK